MSHTAELYERFLAGDQPALAELIGEYKDGLILYLQSIVGDYPSAEELTVDTFVKLGIKRPKYNGTASFKTWLYTIAGNLAKDLLRARARRNEVPLEENVAGEWNELERKVLGDERDRALHSALSGLKREYRQILWLIYFEGFSYKEAAGILHRSVHGAEVLASRARTALREALGKEGFVYEEL